jgi:hypothetical protein
MNEAAENARAFVKLLLEWDRERDDRARDLLDKCFSDDVD